MLAHGFRSFPYRNKEEMAIEGPVYRGKTINTRENTESWT